jgi:RNA polymerase sigma-70 factor (ECF subfamily)
MVSTPGASAGLASSSGGEPVSDRTGGVGDKEADHGLHDLYRTYSGWLTSRLRRRFGDETEDLAQEAWIRAAPYSRKGLIEHPKALLLKIVDNLVIDRARRRGPAPLSASDRLDPDSLVDPASQIDMLLLKQIVMTMPDPEGCRAFGAGARCPCGRGVQDERSVRRARGDVGALSRQRLRAR